MIAAGHGNMRDNAPPYSVAKSISRMPRTRSYLPRQPVTGTRRNWFGLGLGASFMEGTADGGAPSTEIGKHHRREIPRTRCRREIRTMMCRLIECGNRFGLPSCQLFLMFDPLHKWLGIPPREQPPDHYRLLGLKRFESDSEVIDFAADKHLSYLHRFDNGEYAEQAAEVANRVSQARLCLIDPNKRARYDAWLCESAGSVRGDGGTQGSHPVSMAAAVLAPAIRMGGPAARTTSLVARQASAQSAPSNRILTRPDDKANPVSADKHWNIKSAAKRSTDRMLQAKQTLLPIGMIAVICLVLGIVAGRYFLPQAPRSAGSNGINVSADAMEVRPSSGETRVIDQDSVRSERAQRRQQFERVGIPSTASTERVRRELVDRFPPTKRSVIPDADGAYGSTGPQVAASDWRAAREQAITQAKELHELGLHSSSDARLRYSAWSLAANRFLEAGEYALAMEVIADMDAAFHDFDLLGKQGVILAVVSTKLPDSELPNYMQIAERYFESCIQAERFDLCNKYGREVEHRLLGRKPRPQMTSLGNVLARGHFEERWYHEYQHAVRQLATTPDDAEANLLIGEYLAVARGRWSEALPYLLNCSDETMRAAARAELAPKESGTTPAQVGDAWDDAARGSGRWRNRAILMLRAYDWYRTALLKAPLEDRLRAEEKIQGYQKLIPELLAEDRPMLNESK